MGSKIEEFMNKNGYDMSKVPAYAKEMIAKLELCDAAGIDAAERFARAQMMKPKRLRFDVNKDDPLQDMQDFKKVVIECSKTERKIL